LQLSSESRVAVKHEIELFILKFGIRNCLEKSHTDLRRAGVNGRPIDVNSGEARSDEQPLDEFIDGIQKQWIVLCSSENQKAVERGQHQH
jgi:hypothetical protein